MQTILVYAGAGLFLLAMVYYMKQPRGIRNNNPGNIRHGSAQWQGMADIQADSDFVTFNSPVYGIRALAKVLTNYEVLYGLNTVRGLISRWAPATENNTESYVQSVALRVGVLPDQPISVVAYLEPLAKAIIKHENGQQPYSDETIQQGLALA